MMYEFRTLDETDLAKAVATFHMALMEFQYDRDLKWKATTLLIAALHDLLIPDMDVHEFADLIATRCRDIIANKLRTSNYDA